MEPSLATGSSGRQETTIQLELDEVGRLTIRASDGSPLAPALERRIRRDNESRLRDWLDHQCQEIEAGFHSIATVHLGTPAPGSLATFVPTPFLKPEPIPPAALKRGFWDRILPGLRRARERRHASEMETFEAEMADWTAQRAAHDEAQSRERDRIERRVRTETAVMEEELERALSKVQWPRETRVEFAIEDGGARLVFDIDLPEIEDLPTRSAALAARGLKLNIHDRSQAELRKAYATHVHGVVFKLVGLAFAVLPALQECICSGFSQRVDPRTAREREEYLVSVRVKQQSWAAIDFQRLDQLDPVACLEGFDLVRELSSSGRFSAITPIEHLPRTQDGHPQAGEAPTPHGGNA